MARLPKTNRPTRVSFGKNGDVGRRNVCHVSFTSTDLRAPMAANTTVIQAATAASTTSNTIYFPLPNPDVPRNITLTLGGTTANILGGTAVVTGTNAMGATITESLTITAATGGTLTGTKAFNTVTNVNIPIQGASVTVAVGVGNAIGIGFYELSGASVMVWSKLASGAEALTSPTSTVLSSTVLENNTVTINGTLNQSTRFVVYALNYNWALNPVNAFPNWGSK